MRVRGVGGGWDHWMGSGGLGQGLKMKQIVWLTEAPVAWLWEVEQVCTAQKRRLDETGIWVTFPGIFAQHR